MTPLKPTLSPEEDRAQAAVASLSAPVADPEFKEGARRAFVAGTLRPRVPAPRPAGLEIVRWVLPLAAALAVAVGLYQFNHGAPWRMLDAHSGGSIAIDGRSFALTDEAGINSALHPGARLVFGGDGILELGSGRDILFQLNPGADLVLPAVPGRWWGRELATKLSAGEVRIMTGSHFHGAHLEVHTAESDVSVNGTVFSVICFPTGTCVCVFQGTVGVAEHGGRPRMIEGGRRRMIFNDGHPPLEDVMLPVEREKLASFHSVEGPMLEGGLPASGEDRTP